jgi:SAM-dependent methyltransferase
MSGDRHTALERPSAWVVRFAPLIGAGEVLDLACGSGRHARFLAAQGHHVVAVDRDAAALDNASGAGISVLQADLETDTSEAWPFEPNRFAGIVVTNYLHRPLFKHIVNSLAPNGVLIYETFAQGNERFGKPSNPDFLLAPGELLGQVSLPLMEAMRVIAFEDGYVDQPKPAMVQRICLMKAPADVEPSSLRLI